MIKMKRLNKKGMIGLGDIMMLGVSAIILLVAISIFIPIGNILANTTANMPNAGIVMSLIWLIPLVMVGGVIWSFTQKAQDQR